MEKYGSEGYNEIKRELFDRGFSDNYNSNFLEQPFVEDMEDDEEWEGEEYERG